MAGRTWKSGRLLWLVVSVMTTCCDPPALAEADHVQLPASFKGFFGILTLLILTSAVVVREKEGILEMAPVLDGILGCETHGEKAASFPLTGLAPWHTERTRFVILASFFRFVSLSFPPLPSTCWNCGVKVYDPKGPGSVLVPNPTNTPTPPELICELGFFSPLLPLMVVY